MGYDQYFNIVTSNSRTEGTLTATFNNKLATLWMSYSLVSLVMVTFFQQEVIDHQLDWGLISAGRIRNVSIAQ